VNVLHEQFITEARELIEQATEDLVALEREGSAPERIDRLFRAFHTLKGAAAVVELPAMTMTVHAAEDLLAAIQGGRLVISPAMIDQALACLDKVSQWVDEFAGHAALAPSADDDARAIVARLRGFLSGQATKPETASRQGNAGVDRELPGWASRLVESQRARIVRTAQGRAAGLSAICYEPSADCFFRGDDPLRMMRQVPEQLAFDIEAREPWPAVADIDPYACNLRLLAISAADRADIASVFRLVPDQVRIVEIAADDLPSTGEDDAGDATALIRLVIEEQIRVVRAKEHGEDLVGRLGAASRVAANALRHGLREELAQRVEVACSSALSGQERAPLLAALEDALASLGRPASTIDAAPDAEWTPSGPSGSEGGAGRLLRVDECRIDALVNLAGELIVAKNTLAHLAKRVEHELGGHDLGREVMRGHESIERLAGEMHAAILQLRMVPVARVFRSFPRLVRDTARELNKTVTLVFSGETTEADKTIVDHLFEPLLHLVRNALDHGIEAPEQRRAAGKHEAATITMRAWRAGDHFVVEVVDDGRGIDPAIIRRNARERKLLPDDELAALSDEQAIDLIFSAGFSTAAEVTDISGRGVGMDVVRATVERVGGRISLTSRLGAGTTVRLDLPMNIAMSRIMVVETGGQLFGIPMDAVTETVRLTPDHISQIKNNNGFVLRDRIVPICSLAELMDLPTGANSEAGAKLLVVAEMGGKIAALEIDAIRDRLEVVLKPMQGLLAGARGYLGTTLLGDGRVLLVIDLKELVP
jgi:two-component system chemotaxis sensor kinase CheA